MRNVKVYHSASDNLEIIENVPNNINWGSLKNIIRSSGTDLATTIDETEIKRSYIAKGADGVKRILENDSDSIPDGEMFLFVQPAQVKSGCLA